MSLFPSAPIPEKEEKRLQALFSYKILDTAQDEQFDSLTLLTSYICKSPIAIISFMDADRQWFKSQIGIERQEIPREISFCQYTITNMSFTEVEDSLQSERFKNNPLVTEKPHIKFYAGTPLISESGHAIGTLCVMDTKPGKLNQEQRDALRTIARQAVIQLEWRKYTFLQTTDSQRNPEEKLRDLQFQLRQKEIEAMKAKAAKDNFMANMSHEIRTPLNAIIGFSDLLKKTDLEPVQSEYLSSIKTAGENLLATLNDILDLSKIKSGRFSLESAPFQPAKTFEEVINAMQEKASKKNLDLKLKIDSRLPEWLKGDEQRLRQILLNLIDNAIKFTEAGFVSMKVKSVASNAGETELKFTISDSGIGIAEDKLPIIYDRFTQAEEGSTRNYGGTGLGLSIVHSLVENFNGTISVKSKVNKGSQFTLQLPFEVCEHPSGTASKPVDIQQWTKGWILVCEDNLLNQKLAQTVLENLGHSVTVVDNGKEAVEWLQNNHPDLIIMDLQMPEMDGYQATKYIRSKLKLNIPILAMTVGSLAGEKEDCLRIGMDDYLPKPFKEKDLDEKIQQLLSNTGYSFDDEGEKQKSESGGIDLSELETLSHGNSSMLEEMLRIFIEQTTIRLKELEKAVLSNDYEQMRAISHNLKSNYYLVGFKEIELVLTLEQMAKKEEPSEKIHEILRQLIAETDKVIAQIEKRR